MDAITSEVVTRWLAAYAQAISENAAPLTNLDAAIGDADHGANMHRGMQAVVTKLGAAPPTDIAAILKLTAMTLISTVGGSAGPLYGTLFLQMSAASTGKAELSLADWTAAFEAGVKGVQARGKAAAGEKTMLDALIPALDALKASAGLSLRDALAHAAQAAAAGRDTTIPMLATKGRASYLGERSIGHQDPGATSAAMLLQALAAVTA
jgi:dihydroxyacetone kinase-like protein